MAKLAEAVHKGAASVSGVQAQLLAINGDDIVKGRYTNEAVFAKLDASDAIIFGSPTYMGGPAAQFKTFADASGGPLVRRRLAQQGGRPVSRSREARAATSRARWNYFQTLAMQHGMVWIGPAEMPMQPNGVNRLGSFSGVMAQAGQEPPEVAPSEGDKLTGEVFGKRVAEFTLKLKP